MKSWISFATPAFLIAATPLFMVLWAYWTGMWRGVGRMVVAALALLGVFTLASFLAPGWLQTNFLFNFAFGFGGLWALLWGIWIPAMRRALADLPELPRGALLKPRRLEFFKGAFVWPYVAWAAIVAWQFASGDRAWFVWFGPAAGLVGLVMLRPCLRLGVQEPEPLGGPDPEGLARRYEEFRRRRTRTMYWMFLALSLFVTGTWRVFPLHPGWLGAILGVGFGIWGALFGTWADAQRVLLRRQLAGAEPPR